MDRLRRVKTGKRSVTTVDAIGFYDSYLERLGIHMLSGNLSRGGRVDVPRFEGAKPVEKRGGKSSCIRRHGGISDIFGHWRRIQ